jgi:diguanylate cyclase (GGDEF)-like protein
VREVDQRQAVRSAADRAHFVSETLLRESLTERDATTPARGTGLHRLDVLMRRRVLLDGALRVSVISPRNEVTYSTDHRDIGTLVPSPDVRRARAGTVVSTVSSVPSVGGDGTTKALVSFFPLQVGPKTVAVVSIEQRYAPIAAAAKTALLPVAGALELALILLFVLLVPGLARASRSLRDYVAEIRYRATHDALTGLSNREALYEHLAEALGARQPSESVAVLLIDLDRFKEVNDTLGHDAGDELLCDIAGRVSELAGEARVYRLGGDEFAIVVADTTPQAALELADRVRKGIEAPAAVRGIPISVDASIGVAVAPDDGMDVSQLVQHADVAMFVAKQGRAGVMRYHVTIDRNDASKLVLMTELRAAVERGELEVHYQPLVTASSTTLRSAEALVRWRHPTRGLLAPGAFLPLAEHTRLIVDLTRHVLAQAVAQTAVWNREGAEFSVAVNVSVLDLLDPLFVSHVSSTLRKAGFPARCLTIEITEGAFMQEPEKVRRTLNSLRSLGIRIAIDDFGTGYSSLSYLRDLPVDILKIDRSFICDLPRSDASLAIVAAAVELAHRLGLKVVAEGVETDAQRQCLDALGCDLVQGYLVSPPVSASAFTGLVEQSSRVPDLNRTAA